MVAAVTASISFSQTEPRLLEAEFVFEQAPFPSCHASTVVECPSGDLLCAWFGGKDEGDPSVGIWLSRRTATGWSPPRNVAQEPGVPCWNPVLFYAGDGLWLYYKVGPSPDTWTGASRWSADHGVTWSEQRLLPAGLLGPVRAKPMRLANGEILAGSSTESYRAWTGWAELSQDGGSTWQRFGPLALPDESEGLIQPTLWEAKPGHVVALMRATRKIGVICRADSVDGGRTWSPAKRTDLPNPSAGIDAVKLADGRVALVYNPTRSGRSPLSVAISRDDGATWSPPFHVETDPGEYSYPAMIQAKDGTLHLTYTWRRQRIKHAVVAVAPAGGDGGR
jgi:predicted neuraminidase